MFRILCRAFIDAWPCFDILQKEACLPYIIVLISLHFVQVLDEADRLLNEDFEESLNEILGMIPRERRTFLFSATMTKKVNMLVY